MVFRFICTTQLQMYVRSSTAIPTFYPQQKQLGWIELLGKTTRCFLHPQ